MSTERNRVCPVELAPSLDNKMRRWIQDPHRILSPFVKEGMTVLDLGCGPGYFSIEMAHLVGAHGKVISADLQQGMLAAIEGKISGSEIEGRINRVQCTRESINVAETADFILAFYMVHEVPDKNSLFRQLKGILRPDGRFLLVEPKLFHVSRAEWKVTLQIASASGFTAALGPRLGFSWSALLTHA
jgi:ubiquinone/menaquinone biosynthesis C-methylase UbiE